MPATAEEALADLEEIYRAVFGSTGSEPNVYADYDKLIALETKMVRALATLKAEIDEDTVLFELRHEADHRAIERWRKATGRTLTLPDHADLCVWLLEKLDAAGGQP